jgi:Phosphatidylinositol N-acetylglucosaminyltransferase subunit Y
MSEDQACKGNADWQRNWQRVASTHTLEDLLIVDQPPEVAPPICWKTLATGLGCLAGGLMFILVLPAWLLATIVPFQVPAPPWLSFFILDKYYGALLAMTVPTALAAVTLHWVASKLFKHNY